jgi:HlyD family secretion protein
LERQEDLKADHYVSAALLDQESTNVETTAAQLEIAESSLINARAVFEQKMAILSQSKLDLERTEIRSPVAGTVINRTVEQGQTVAASLQAPELFQIAQDLHEMQVEASVDEADIGRIKEGMTCRFTVDAYPERSFTGRIEQIRKAPDKVQNVVTYRVIITASNQDLALFPGMTANVEIVLGSRMAVLQVPNSALRFTPKTRNTDSERQASSRHGRGPGDLLKRMEAVIELNETQKAEIAKLATNQRSQFRRPGNSVDREEMRANMKTSMAKLNSRVRALLEPQQQQKFDELVSNSRQHRSQSRSATVWQLDDGNPVAINIRTGLADDRVTEIIHGLAAGEEVIVRAVRRKN